MSKNVIHNFNLSIKNSADIKSSEHLTETIIKELAKVSKEMSQQKDIVQLLQEQNNQTATAILNNSTASAEGGAIDTSAGTMQNPMQSIINTPSELEVRQDSNVSTGIGESGLFTTSTTASIEGGAADNTLRTEMSSSISTGITPSIMRDQDFSNQVYSGISAQQNLMVPESLQINSNEPSVDVIKAEVKKKLDAAVIENDTESIKYWTSISKAFDEGATVFDFDDEKDQRYFEQMYFKLQKGHFESITNNVNWGEVSGLMILKLLKLSKGGKDVYLKEYYDLMIEKIKDPDINIQQLFSEHEELFLLLKSVFPNLPSKITIQTPKVIYPNLGSQKMYPNIGVEKMHFIWSGTLGNDVKYNSKGFQYEPELGTCEYAVRNYDAALGRWMNIDSLTEGRQNYEGDVFSFNNSVRFVDLDGHIAGPGDGLGPGGAPPGEVVAKHNAIYLKPTPNGVLVLAPDGKYHKFDSRIKKYTYSDGKIHEGQQKKEGVWSVTNKEGNFMWNNIKGKFVLNTSDRGGGRNVFPLLDPPGTTYAGGENPKNKITGQDDYSQPPQNLADYAGYLHDKEYDKLNLRGKDGTSSPLSSGANRNLINSCKIILSMYAQKKTDPFTGAPVSQVTMTAAYNIIVAFNLIEEEKKQNK